MIIQVEIPDKIKEYFERREKIIEENKLKLLNLVKNFLEKEIEKLMIEKYGEHEGSGKYLNDEE